MTQRSVTVLCGGVGAARFLRGLVDVVPQADVTAIANIADDVVLHGLHISPDIDTITYTLAGEIDPQRGWGLRDESWQAMTTLARYGSGDWFSLGDRDLGTHLHRTQRLSEGMGLTEVTAEITRAWGLDLRLLPVTDDPVSTRVVLADGGAELGFQEYFVGLKHDVAISEVRFAGAESAKASDSVIAAISDSDVVIIAPSNPIVSIGPLLEMDQVADALRSRQRSTVAISPIVGGAALKGPAARMLTELGHEASVAGVARIWADVADVLVIDDADAGLAAEVAGIETIPFVTDTIMADASRSAALARACLSAAELGVVNRRERNG